MADRLWGDGVDYALEEGAVVGEGEVDQPLDRGLGGGDGGGVDCQMANHSAETASARSWGRWGATPGGGWGVGKVLTAEET